MRALTFIEYYKQETEYSADSVSSILKTDRYLKLLSQTFTPSMITEYFEGWEYVTNAIPPGYFNNTKLPDSNVAIRFADKKFNISIGDYILQAAIDLNFQHPINLNDFICDCKLARIELTFKEEIVNKYLNN